MIGIGNIMIYKNTIDFYVLFVYFICVLYNLYITVEGFVRPCSSIHINLANIKDYSLKEVINLPFFKLSRTIEKKLKGKCKTCGYHSECIGCRGLAFSCAKNRDLSDFEAICMEDPSCFYDI